MNQNNILGTGTNYDPCTDPFEVVKTMNYSNPNLYVVSTINNANDVQGLSIGDTILEESTGLLYYWSGEADNSNIIGQLKDPTKIWVDSLISDLVLGLKINGFYRYILTCPSWLAKKIKQNKNGMIFGEIVENDSTNDIEIKIKFGEK